jgi:hypothetical protein
MLPAVVIVTSPFWSRSELHSVEIPDKRITLPAPRPGAISVEKVLRERRSIREFKRQPLSLTEVSQLLWAAQGITGSGGLRTAPSAGALLSSKKSGVEPKTMMGSI